MVAMLPPAACQAGPMLILGHRGASATLPENTLEAFADHGNLARTVDTVSSIVDPFLACPRGAASSRRGCGALPAT